MYNYEVGYSTYESVGYHSLTHDNKFSKEELYDIVSDCAAEVIYEEHKKYIEKHDEELDDMILETYFSDIIKLMKEKYNFKDIEYEAVFDSFGWLNLMGEENWGNIPNNDIGYQLIYKKYQKHMEQK